MRIELFLKNKIARQLKINGKEYEFEKYEVDKYNQITENVVEILKVKGLFHTTNAYITNNNTEGGRTVSKQQPMLLVMYDDGLKICKDDGVEISGIKYKVTDKNNINNFNVAFEISLVQNE